MTKEFDFDEHRTMFLDSCFYGQKAGRAADYSAPVVRDAAHLEELRTTFIEIVRRRQEWIRPTDRQVTEYFLEAHGYAIPPDDHDYWKALGL